MRVPDHAGRKPAAAGGHLSVFGKKVYGVCALCIYIAARTIGLDSGNMQGIERDRMELSETKLNYIAHVAALDNKFDWIVNRTL